MCAQTLVYGTLSSRVTSPEDFGSSPIFSAVPLGNPFLEAFFEEVHDQAVELDLAGSDLPQLSADLRKTNVEHILDQFGSTAKGGDPVIHFYEEFLKKYDSKMRADAGSFLHATACRSVHRPHGRRSTAISVRFASRGSRPDTLGGGGSTNGLRRPGRR